MTDALLIKQAREAAMHLPDGNFLKLATEADKLLPSNLTQKGGMLDTSEYSTPEDINAAREGKGPVLNRYAGASVGLSALLGTIIGGLFAGKKGAAVGGILTAILGYLAYRNGIIPEKLLRHVDTVTGTPFAGKKVQSYLDGKRGTEEQVRISPADPVAPGFSPEAGGLADRIQNPLQASQQTMNDFNNYKPDTTPTSTAAVPAAATPAAGTSAPAAATPAAGTSAPAPATPPVAPTDTSSNTADTPREMLQGTETTLSANAPRNQNTVDPIAKAREEVPKIPENLFPSKEKTDEVGLEQEDNSGISDLIKPEVMGKPPKTAENTEEDKKLKTL